MNIIIYIFSGFFALMAVAVMFGYFRTGHLGLFLIALVYGASAVMGLVLMHWWPLTAGFALAWGMKMIGLEPPQAVAESQGDEQSKIRES
jgi:4-hydroxybenzoate polyprenyltransferase